MHQLQGSGSVVGHNEPMDSMGYGSLQHGNISDPNFPYAYNSPMTNMTTNFSHSQSQNVASGPSTTAVHNYVGPFVKPSKPIFQGTSESYDTSTSAMMAAGVTSFEFPLSHQYQKSPSTRIAPDFYSRHRHFSADNGLQVRHVSGITLYVCCKNFVIVAVFPASL